MVRVLCPCVVWLLAAAVFLCGGSAVSGDLSSSSSWRALSSSSGSPSAASSTGSPWYQTGQQGGNGGVSSSSSAPIPQQSTGGGMTGNGTGRGDSSMPSNSSNGSGTKGGDDAANWNATGCANWFNGVVQPLCQLPALASITGPSPFCSLSCAAVLPDWFHGCVDNSGPLLPTLAALGDNSKAVLAALGSMAANCSVCGRDTLRGFYATCQVNQSQSSALPVNNSATDLLQTMQFPAVCPAQCAGNFSSALLPFYNACIAPYGASIPASAAMFIQQCSPPTAPSPVTGIAALALSASQVSISWSPAAVLQSPLDGGPRYVVLRGSYQLLNYSYTSATGAVVVTNVTYPAFVPQFNFTAGNATQLLDGSVVGGSRYVYGVIACNSVGCSPPASQVTVTTPALPPKAPASLMASALTATSATVTWPPSQGVQGDNSSLYYVLSRQVLGSPLPLVGLYRGFNTSFTFSDLQPNTTYFLSVVAATPLAGQSLNATTANFTSMLAQPSPVLGLTASSVSLAKVVLQWSPPAQFGSFGIVYYTVYVASAAMPPAAIGNATAGLFDTASVGLNLSVVTQYAFSVTATNTGGLTSILSAPIIVRTPANAPTVRNPLVPAVSPLGGVVQLMWNQSADINNGGSNITALHISLMSARDSREIDLPASAHTITVSALNATANYSVTWRAMNAYGWSAPGPVATFLTKSAPPTIVAFTAGDNCACRTSFGVNSTLTIQFSTSVMGPSISTQAGVDALFVFVPAIPGSYAGEWTNNGSAAVITVTAVSSAAATYTIGLVSAVVNSTLFDASNRSASAMGAMSPPLFGSWYGAPRTVRFFGVNQTSIAVQEDSVLNPISVIPAPNNNSLQSTAVLTLTVMYGSLAVARLSSLSSFNASVTAAGSQNVTLSVPYSALSGFLAGRQLTYTPLRLSTAPDVLIVSVVDVLATGGNPADSVNIPILISSVNHPPSIRFVGAALPSWVFGSSYTLPAINVSDVDAAAYPTAPISVVVSAQSVTALLTTNASIAAPSSVTSSVLAGNSAPTLTFSGPLADLNAFLASSPISIADSGMPPSASQASLLLFVNDNGNGGGAPLTFSAPTPVAVTCNNTAAPTPTSAQFASDAGVILITFSSPLDQSATTSTNCSLFFDQASTVSTFGANPSCPFRGSSQLAVVLGFGSTILPTQTLTFSNSSAVRRCAGGAMLTGSIPVQSPATTVTPVVTISGPSTVSSCDSLTLYGQATGLGGRPATATYSWTVSVGSTSDATQAIAANNVLGSSATAAVLSVSSTALYASNAYYFFYLTVSNFLGASNTSSIVVYKSQLALPNLQPQGSSALTVSASSAFFVAVTPVLSSCLTGSNKIMNFNWSISPPVANQPPSNNPQINIPPYLLKAGNTYTFTLRGAMAADSTLVSSTNITVSVPASPIAVTIAGGAVQQTSQLVPLSLTANSMDPDVTSVYGNWSFAWSCLSAAGSACLDSQLGSQLSTAVAGSNVSSSTIAVAAGKLAAGLYTWSVVATNGVRTAMSSVSVSVVANPIPVVSISSYLSIVNPNGMLYYRASVSDVTNTPLAFSWSQVSGPALSLSAIAVSLRTPTLVLNNQGASVFTSGATYAFQCVVVNGFNQSSFGQVSVTINAPPHGGSLSVSPSSGYAFNTSFALSAAGWQSSTGSALSYQFFAVSADKSLTQLNVMSGASVFNTQLAQGRNTNVTVLVVVTDALGATATFSAVVAVQAPPGLANDTTGAVFSSILSSAATSASQTSNVGQLFGTLNALQDSIYLALLGQQGSGASSSRRLLSYTASGVTALKNINSQTTALVNANLAQTDLTTAVNAAIKQSSQASLTYASTVTSVGQSILASVSTSAKAISTATDAGRASALSAATSVIQLAGQQLAVIQLAEASASIDNSSAQAVTTALLSNISAQCDSLSASLQVAGQMLAVDAGSSIFVYVGRNAVSDTSVYPFSGIDNTTVSFPAYSIAGAQPMDGSAALSNSSSQLLDSRVFYMAASPYVWANNPMVALSPVVYAARVSTVAAPLAGASASVVTMVASLPVTTTACPAASCSAVCFVWDSAHSLWNSSAALVWSSTVYAASSGQSFVDCSVRGATAASVGVMAVNTTGATAAPAVSSSSSAPASAPASTGSSAAWSSAAQSAAQSAPLSSSSSAARLSSSSSYAAAGVTSSPTLLYPAGSQQIGFYLNVPTSTNLSSPVFLFNLTSDLAFNLASFYNLSTAQMLPYVKLISVTLSSGAPSARRRLLQATNTATVEFVVSGAVSALNGVNASAAASLFKAAAASGNLTAPSTGAQIPSQTVTVADANAPSASSSSTGGLGSTPPNDSSSSNTPLAIGLGVGLGVPALVVIVALIYFFVVKGGSAPVANGMLHQRLPAASASQ